jgi:arsenate reductase (thioredoxin)
MIEKATHHRYNAVINLLQSNHLPVADIDKALPNFWVAMHGEQLVGAIGMEQYGSNALLRSAVVDDQFRNKGIATQLVDAFLTGAAWQLIDNVYLLTTTAKSYFEHKGFAVVDRSVVPDAVQQSAEFSHLCPSSATVMHRSTNRKKKLLFVCVENSNRSQMSQAFAQLLGGDKVVAFSAGSKPSGIINPKAIAAMQALGYNLGQHESKSLDIAKTQAPFDAVVTMGCGDACPWIAARHFVDWQIPDPKHMEPEQFNEVRDFVKSKVEALLVELGVL